jgi:hypothetical protein|tara:strand:+ start:169 stop:432 length:264 start_codon:yes stop_codon:yes gene_type:complete
MRNKEIIMNKDFEMFTKNGNAAVEKIVESAILGKCDWAWVENKLTELSAVPLFDEATDTAVRESVYKTLMSIYTENDIWASTIGENV